MTRDLTKDDLAILAAWTASGFVESGRIASRRCDDGSIMLGSREGSTWCRLSDEAMTTAHRLRRECATRRWARRPWETTDEKRGAETT